jgi:hypothetical protein
MLIASRQVTDTLYQTVQELLKQQGIEEAAPLRQSVLLGNCVFLGYRFTGEHVQIDWLAQKKLILIKKHTGEILFQCQIDVQNSNLEEISQSEDQHSVAA